MSVWQIFALSVTGFTCSLLLSTMFENKIESLFLFSDHVESTVEVSITFSDHVESTVEVSITFSDHVESTVEVSITFSSHVESVNAGIADTQCRPQNPVRDSSSVENDAIQNNGIPNSMTNPNIYP